LITINGPQEEIVHVKKHWSARQSQMRSLKVALGFIMGKREIVRIF